MKSLGMVLVIGASCAMVGAALASPCDPLLVHVSSDGGGVVLSSPAAGVNFDLRGDGVIRTGWPTTANDAWLVLPDVNGAVTSGLQMFGDYYSKGGGADAYGSLAQYDEPGNGGDGDGAITERDAIYNSLRLWADANRDGVSQPAELRTLASYGITALVLYAYGSVTHDGFGNAYMLRSKVVGADGIEDTKRFVQAVIPAIGAAPSGHTSAVACDDGGGGGGAPPPSPPPTQWHCTSPCYGVTTATGNDFWNTQYSWISGLGLYNEPDIMCGPTVYTSFAQGWPFYGSGASASQSASISAAEVACVAARNAYVYRFRWPGDDPNTPTYTRPYSNQQTGNWPDGLRYQYPGMNPPFCGPGAVGTSYCLQY